MPRVLTAAEREFLASGEARTASLATIDPDGRPRLVPICFVVYDDLVWTPLDEKPKAVDDPHRLARVRDIARDPRVTVLIDKWSEDWSELGWLRLDGRAQLTEALPAVVDALRAKYPQYADHDLERRPVIRISIEGATSWGRLDPT